MKNKKILDKVRKLFEINKENGATEGEIENALKMAQRLMIRYNIDHKDISFSPLDIDIEFVENSFKTGEPKFWIWDILGTIGKSYNCQVLRSKDGRKHYYKIIGFETDRIIVKETFIAILPVIRNLINIRYKEYTDNTCKLYNNMSIADLERFTVLQSKKDFIMSYIYGFRNGLERKLFANREEYLKLESERGLFDLMVIKKDTLINDFIDAEYKPTTAKVRKVMLHEDIYRTGIADGAENGATKGLH